MQGSRRGLDFSELVERKQDQTDDPRQGKQDQVDQANQRAENEQQRSGNITVDVAVDESLPHPATHVRV